MNVRIVRIVILAWMVATLGRAAAQYDVVVYGATPAGVVAAMAAADDGERVLLVESTGRIGGMMTSGLSHTDFRTFESLNGAYFNLARWIEAYYRDTYGEESPELKACLRGTQAEPKVVLLVMEQRLAARGSRIEVWRTHRLTGVRMISDAAPRRVAAATFKHEKSGRSVEVAGRFFIDASYEGDLMAAAGVEFRVGREGRDAYDESLAPPKDDAQLQGYNFRFCMTRDPANRVAPAPPAGYRPDEFTEILPLLESGRIKTIFGYPGGCIYKAQIPAMPNGKYDINDVSRGLVRLSLPGENTAWPEGDAEMRRRIFDAHLRWQVGLLYFLQNDTAVPARFREEAREWGWCRDEFVESAHLPPQLYVREARRMVGAHVFTERDMAFAAGDARAVLHRDSIAIGDYGPNCHGTDHEGSRFGGRHSGEFYQNVAPYQIPYGVLLPRDVDNLLVPCAVSSSHVGFCALRLEPIWMSLGQAAGHAAHLALARGLAAQRVPVARLRARLYAAGAATIYLSDVPPDHPDFALVQWWGSIGGWHGVTAAPGVPGERGKNIQVSGVPTQYYEAYPHHAAELERVLDPLLARRWAALAAEQAISIARLPLADGKITRREWLDHVWRARSW